MGSFLSRSYSHLLVIIASVSFSLSFMPLTIGGACTGAGNCIAAEEAASGSMTRKPSRLPRRAMRRSTVMPYVRVG